MGASVFEYTCARCGSLFEASGIGDFFYGEFIMRTASGEEAFLEAVVSPVFHEFIDLADKHPLTPGKDDRRRSCIVQAAFSVACDPGIGGERFHIELGPKCPVCSSHDMKTWRPVEPPRSSTIAAPSHVEWSSLSLEEKQALIDKSIRFCIENTDPT
jgi:hypothetical protein